VISSVGYLSTQDMTDQMVQAQDEAPASTPRSMRERFSDVIHNVERWTKRSTSREDSDEDQSRHRHTFHTYDLGSAMKSPTARRPSANASSESPDMSTIHVRRSSAFKHQASADASSPKSDHSGNRSPSPRATQKRASGDLSQPLIDAAEDKI
jgi:hypothetical protein